MLEQQHSGHHELPIGELVVSLTKPLSTQLVSEKKQQLQEALAAYKLDDRIMRGYLTIGFTTEVVGIIRIIEHIRKLVATNIFLPILRPEDVTFLVGGLILGILSQFYRRLYEQKFTDVVKDAVKNSSLPS